jgi:hypothetical protein
MTNRTKQPENEVAAPLFPHATCDVSFQPSGYFISRTTWRDVLPFTGAVNG